MVIMSLQILADEIQQILPDNYKVFTNASLFYMWIESLEEIKVVCNPENGIETSDAQKADIGIFEKGSDWIARVAIEKVESLSRPIFAQISNKAEKLKETIPYLRVGIIADNATDFNKTNLINNCKLDFILITNKEEPSENSEAIRSIIYKEVAISKQLHRFLYRSGDLILFQKTLKFT